MLTVRYSFGRVMGPDNVCERSSEQPGLPLLEGPPAAKWHRQHELAALLGYEQSHISALELGVRGAKPLIIN